MNNKISYAPVTTYAVLSIIVILLFLLFGYIGGKQLDKPIDKKMMGLYFVYNILVIVIISIILYLICKYISSTVAWVFMAICIVLFVVLLVGIGKRQ